MPERIRTERIRRSRTDWIDAAIRLGTRVGFDHLAVQPLARQMGTTKGGFYWHFDGLTDLIDAVVAYWEERATAQVLTEIDGYVPGQRPRQLIERVLDIADHDAAEWAMLSAVAHPRIGPVVRRVHTTRIDYLRRLAQQLGARDDEADARARVAYTAYLGHLQLIHGSGLPAPSTGAREGFRELVIELLGGSHN